MVFLLLAPPAFAADVPLSCESAASLRAKVKDCEGNLAYATAGKSCLDAFDAAVAGARASVAKALGAVVSADKQSQSMDNAKKGYQTAVATLGSLSEQGRRLGRQVESYKQEIVFPDDFGAAGEAGLSASIFLDNQKCYSATRKLVDSYAELLGLHAKELDLTKQIADALASRAFKGESNLKPGDILPLLSAPPAAGEAKAGRAKTRKAGSSGAGKSDITGTEKKDDNLPSK